MTTNRRALTDDERREQLASLAGWTVVSSALPHDPSVTRTELYKVYKFPSFDDALRFMQSAAPFINETDHHPRWENSYRTLAVYLSTHDSAHSVTALDVALARHLDSLVAATA